MAGHIPVKKKPRKRKPKPKARRWPTITRLTAMIRREATRFKYNNPNKDSVHAVLYGTGKIIHCRGIKR